MTPTVVAGSVVVLLFSVIVHEVMHGLAALKFGDHTAERAGRLTLNPLPHIDLIGTILVPLLLILPALVTGTSPGFLIGWAKPVPINPFNFSDIRKGELVVASAGILANFGLAIIGAIIFHLCGSFLDLTFRSILLFAININLILGIFNALPIPPLDGSKILMSYLPTKLALELNKIEPYGIFVLFFLLFFPVGNSSLLGVILEFFLSIFHLLLGL